MSVEELKIRGELEVDVERDLEEEIKQGIYHLALKLHQLYQNKKPKYFDQEYTMSEVNINIRMEGGTIIRVKEIKKEGSRINHPTLASTAKSQPNVGGRCTGRSTPHNEMKLNWEKSLRKESNPSIFIKKILPKKSVGYVNSSTKHSMAENKVLELGWKY